MIKGSVVGISHAVITNAIKAMKTGKAAGLSKVNLKMIAASGQAREEKIRELCHRVLNENGMSETS